RKRRKNRGIPCFYLKSYKLPGYNKVKPGLPAKTSSTFSTLRLEIPEICNQSSSYGSSLA
ncbi:MAG: hypothetical protein LBQ57_06160, partial [Spirochaetales bacterium]|nr:hypothetical protein [Spirochaetales bacterium]